MLLLEAFGMIFGNIVAMATLLSFFTLTYLPQTVGAAAGFSLPTAEYEALYDLFSSTDGENWAFVTPSSPFNGYPWEFIVPPQNPCSSTMPWQGIICSSTCQTKPCNILEISLENFDMYGVLPSSIGNFSALQVLDLSGNELFGEIPKTIGNLKFLTSLAFNLNTFTGTIPYSIGLSSTLAGLDLSDNLLTGFIPSSLFQNATQLQQFYAFENHLSGSLPATSTSTASLTSSPLRNIVLYANRLTGFIPSSWGDDMKFLQMLRLSQNRLIGNIPDTFMRLSRLQVLDLSENGLTGTLLDSLSAVTSLQQLYFFVNFLTGTIPESWGSLTSLQYLELSFNHLNGTITSSLSALNKLSVLDLMVNELTGTLSSNLTELQRLNSMSLSYNHFARFLLHGVNC
jgi:Leucine-rich repeat (LRR) protein